MRSARLPGAPEGTERVICHVDVDCFYAACERLREPALRGHPVVVGMGYEPGETTGAVATASYEAREYGVESAQAISEALDRLPRKVDAASDPELDVADAGFYRPVDMDYYESVADEVREILDRRGDTVRTVSIDEAYLDVTDSGGWDDPGAFGRDLKAEIEAEVGVTASVGIAPTMSAAKVASDRDKPDGLVVVEPGQVREFFAPLPVESVHGIGPVTARELREMGVETAGDLATADPARLEDRFGERGLAVRRYARGEDDRAVEPKGDPKSLSRESAFAEASADQARARETVRGLAAAVAERAGRKGALYRTIGLKVVTPPFEVHTRAETLPGPVDDPDLVEELALALLAEFEGEPIRKLGVRVSNLSFGAGEQIALDGVEGTDAPSEGQGAAGLPDGEESAGTSDGEGSAGTPESDGSTTSGRSLPRQCTLAEFRDG